MTESSAPPIPQDQPTDEQIIAWPNCATPDCEHKCCLIMESAYCSPCSARLHGLTMDQWRQQISQRRKELGYD